MAQILPTKSLYYNDVNLIGAPAPSHLKSRSQVPIEKYRIIASPMDAVIGYKFVVGAAVNGISVLLPRFKSNDWQLDLYNNFYKRTYGPNFCCCSVGLKDFEKNVKYFIDAGVRNLGIDIANGYLDLSEYYYMLKSFEFKFDRFYIGNIHSKYGIYNFSKFNNICNELLIRVGIGGGSPCLSSDMAGVNRGAITELMECADTVSDNQYIIADGGISKPGFASKAFAAGADYTMLGGYFSKALEAQTNVDGDGSYWGGASDKQLKLIGQTHKHAEGRTIEKNSELLPLSKLVDDLWGGISSYVTYSGYDSLSKAIGNGTFEIKQNSLPPKNR